MVLEGLLDVSLGYVGQSGTRDGFDDHIDTTILRNLQFLTTEDVQVVHGRVNVTNQGVIVLSNDGTVLRSVLTESTELNRSDSFVLPPSVVETEETVGSVLIIAPNESSTVPMKLKLLVPETPLPETPEVTR